MLVEAGSEEERNQERKPREQMCRWRNEGLEAIEERGAKMDPGQREPNYSRGKQEAKMGAQAVPVNSLGNLVEYSERRKSDQ